MALLLIKFLRIYKKMKIFLTNFYKWIYCKLDKIVDNSIQSILSPQFFSVIIPLALGTCYHENIIHTITNTQAKILLQKEHLDPLQYQITETWVATSSLLFLLREYDKSKNKKKKENQNQNSIREAYNYWIQITNDWEKKWRAKFENELKKNELNEQFNNIVKYFKKEFFDRLNTCYHNHYSKNQSCITPTRTLPLPANDTEYQKKIYSFFVTKSKE